MTDMAKDPYGDAAANEAMTKADQEAGAALDAALDKLG